MSQQFRIWSNEHGAWWRQGGWGYTPSIDEFADREAFTAYWCKLYVGPLDLSVPVYRIEFGLFEQGDSDA